MDTAAQRDLVYAAKTEVEEAAKRVEESVHLVASLRAQVKGAKAQLTESQTGRVVKLRVRKAQDKLSAVETRVEEALASVSRLNSLPSLLSNPTHTLYTHTHTPPAYGLFPYNR